MFLYYGISNPLWGLRSIDDSYAPMVSSLNDVLKMPTISTDYLSTRTWNIFHHAGFHTSAHKDAAGLGTFVVVEHGVKMWNIIRPSGGGKEKSYQDMENHHMEMIKETEDFGDETWRMQWHEDKDVEVVLLQLEEGDLLCVFCTLLLFKIS